MINVFQPSLGEEELSMLRQVFESNWLGRGKLCLDFEAAFAKFIGVDPLRCLSISSCTEGLFLAMQLIAPNKIGVLDFVEVILPTISFHGAGEAILAAGMRPVLCDVDFRSLNPTLENIIEVYNKKKTAAICLLHYGGRPCDEIAEIASFARDNRIMLIEDSACSVASFSLGKACGTFGDIGVWSFDSMKILSTGDGGMMYIKDPYLRERAETLAWLGVTTKSGLTSTKREWWEFQVESVGRRMLMNDITAALGLVQLDKLPTFIARRKAISELYDNLLADTPWLKLPPRPRRSDKSSYYLYWVRLDNAQRRVSLARHLRDMGVYTTFRYWPLHLTGYFGPKDQDLVGADHASARTLNLPIHQALTDDEVKYICDQIIAFGKEKRW